MAFWDKWRRSAEEPEKAAMLAVEVIVEALCHLKAVAV